MVEDDDMRAVFFDPEDFGEVVTVTPESGEPFDLTGIYDARPVENRPLLIAQVGFKDGMQNTGAGPQFRCRTSDVAALKAGKATITRSEAMGGDVFNVWDTKPDGTGLTILILKLAGTP